MNFFLLEVELTNNLLIAYVAILVMAVVPIWWGAHLSLNQKAVESMTSEDAWKFPFIGSAFLFGLYLLFKMFSPDWINFVLTGYFLFFGILAVGATLKPLFNPFFKRSNWEFTIKPFWKVFESNPEPFQIKFDQADIVAYFFSFLIGIWYITTKNWIANNIFGLAFSIEGIALLSLGSYKVGCILLSGLFVYDIFWVFGTDVMVTVAKSFDAPVKLLFPKELFAEKLQYSMLGLGDIVIPGIFIALLLRFDFNRSKQKDSKKQNFSKFYFYSCFIAYIIGLVSTVVVMHTFQAAQPALLYLVPACIGCSFSVALLRGELGLLLAYSEETEKPENVEGKTDKIEGKKVDKTEKKKA